MKKIFVIFAVSFIAHTAHSMDIKLLLNAPLEETVSSSQPKNKNYYCNIGDCKKKFSRPYNAQIHREKKHTGIDYACAYFGCKEQFESKSLLREHVNVNHNHYAYNKIYQCPYCKKKYESGSTCISHIWVNHENNFFWCNFGDCQKRFTLKILLKQHRKEHEIKHFLCCFKECKQSFETLQEFKNHSRYKHPKNVLRQPIRINVEFICSYAGCSQLCPTQNDLAHHIADTHTFDAVIIDKQNIQE